MTNRGRCLRSDRGAQIIELALVTPLLLLLLGGLFDFGFLFRSWEVTTNAAREGARVAALPGYGCVSGNAGQVEPRVAQYLATAGMTGAIVDVTPEQVGAGGVFAGCKVTVRFNQPLPSLGVFSQLFTGSASIELTSVATMRAEAQVAP